MDMKTFLIFYVSGIFLLVFFICVSSIVEKKINENHPLKKWWRKNVIQIAPDDLDI